MPGIGPTELIIILVIVLILFGVGRVSKIGGEMGKAIHEFRAGLSSAEPNETEENSEQAAS
jgi:sec-independent protein translocase protein TatA